MHYAMKTYGGVDVQHHELLASALDWGEWLDSRSGHFIPGERDPVHIRYETGEPKSPSRRCGVKSLCPCREMNPGRPDRSLSLYPLSCPCLVFVLKHYLKIRLEGPKVVTKTGVICHALPVTQAWYCISAFARSVNSQTYNTFQGLLSHEMPSHEPEVV
jgi:hypothetical protein